LKFVVQGFFVPVLEYVRKNVIAHVTIFNRTIVLLPIDAFAMVSYQLYQLLRFNWGTILL